MHLERCSEQSHRTIDEFYQRLADSDDSMSRECGRATLALLARLRALPDDRRVFALTSHYQLCLLARDDSSSPWHVRIGASPQVYSIEYLMPRDLAPRPDAYVQGMAKTEDAAIEMVLTAMERSSGWAA